MINPTLRKFCDAIFLISTGAILYSLFSRGFNVNIINETRLIFIIPLIILNYAFRSMRIFIIFLERKIPFKKILNIYFYTSLGNFFLPLKAAEVFKVSELSLLCGNSSLGVLTVVVERFLDACILLLILVLAILFFEIPFKDFSFLVFFMGTIISLSFIVFLAFPHTSYYMNRLLFRKSSSHQGYYFLNLVEALKKIYLQFQSLLQKRLIVLYLISAIIWLIEITIIFILFRKPLSVNIIHESLQALFLGINNILLSNHSSTFFYYLKDNLSILVLLLVSAVFLPFTYFPIRLKQIYQNLIQLTKKKKNYKLLQKY